MRIVFQECKKAFTSPILLGLLVVFSAFNIFLIVSNTYFKDELKIANELAKTYGVEITDESLSQFEQDIKSDLGTLTSITGTKYENVNAFLDDLSLEAYEKYSKEEQSFFHQLQLKEMYLDLAKNIDRDYAELDMQQVAEVKITQYHLTGKAAEVLRNEGEELSTRFEQLKQNGEHKEWFFAGKSYEMHSFLFRTLFKTFMFEALILIVLTTAMLTTYEFENRSHLVVYTTRRPSRIGDVKAFLHS